MNYAKYVRKERCKSESMAKMKQGTRKKLCKKIATNQVKSMQEIQQATMQKSGQKSSRELYVKVWQK